MIRLNRLFTLGVLALALSGAAAQAQYTVTGTTATGGNIIVGNGVSLGSINTGNFLTVNGDKLTFNLGSLANDFNSIGATVLFSESSGNLVTNRGIILGNGNGSDSDFTSSAIGFTADGTLSNNTVFNYGTISADDNSGGNEVVGTGIALVAGNGVFNTAITNFGNISGGSDSGQSFLVGSGIAIFDFDNGAKEVNGVTINNSGNIAGGSFNDEAELSMGTSILIGGLGPVQNVTINNLAGGFITGGDSNDGEGNNEDEFQTPFVGVGIVIANTSSEEDSGFGITNNIHVTNAGSISGGNDNTYGEIVGTALHIGSNDAVTNVVISNTGHIQGGSGNAPDDDFIGGSISVGDGINIAILDDNFAPNVDVDDIEDAIDTVLINNFNTIAGGNDNVVDGDSAGNGITFTGTDADMGDITINNYHLIRGGFENEDGEFLGSGIGFEGFDIFNVNITNHDRILGGGRNDDGEFAGVGIGFSGIFAEDIHITNDEAGVIAGGDSNFDAEFPGAGIAFITEESLSNVGILNAGLIRGGDFNGGSEFAGAGIAIKTFNADHVLILNTVTGKILGGSGFVGEGSNDGGYGIVIDANDIKRDVIQPDVLPQDSEEFTLNNVGVVNFGLVKGGDGASDGEDTSGGGVGIGIYAEGNTNAFVTNWGTVRGGDSPGIPGIGIQLGFDTEFASTDHATINNWGLIASGNNGKGLAIDIHGDDNVVNLNGHSVVLGKIQAEGKNNTLNLNFTGLSPADTASLQAFIAAQGGPDNFNGTFTVRGVKYTIDPINIKFNTSSYQGQGVTQNQGAIGQNLDSMLVNPTGDLLHLVNAIDLSGDVPSALEQLSPQKYQIYNDIALSNANNLTLEIDHRLNNLRDGSESIDTGAMGGDDNTVLGFSKDNDAKDHKGTINVEKERHWGFFASGRYTDATLDGDVDLQDASFNTAGAVLGVDGIINDKWVVGALFNYEHTSADLDGQGSSADIDSYGGGLFAGYHNGGYYGNGLLAYAHNEYDSTRNILFPGFSRVAAGSTSGNQFEANLDGGYDFKITDRFTVGPILGLQYVHNSVDGFNETGAGAANLAVGDQDVDSLRSRLGIRADYHLELSKKVTFAVEGHAEWQHEFLNDSQNLTSSFIGAGLAPFTVQTSSPDRDAVLAGVSVNTTVKNRYTLFMDYDVQAGGDRYFEQSIKGGVKIKF